MVAGQSCDHGTCSVIASQDMCSDRIAGHVSFVLAMNRVNIVAVTAILVLHVGGIGHHVARH